MKLKTLLTASAIGALFMTQASAGTLVINSNQSDPAPKAAWEKSLPISKPPTRILKYV